MDGKPAKRAKVIADRFDVMSHEEVEMIKKGCVPDNTSKNTTWAMRVFDSWRSFRNESAPEEEQCPVHGLTR